ncbi:unnamed protein product [Cyclocybe aegerita]|uniref:Uncharacterized protein n=1 Tax=Cyclocybe aegerita TaxID=1973307 RepID=A0A8S0Y0A0_CYCAE|nr:unnamed protein product [Cyclocybe aegerita]
MNSYTVFPVKPNNDNTLRRLYACVIQQPPPISQAVPSFYPIRRRRELWLDGRGGNMVNEHRLFWEHEDHDEGQHVSDQHMPSFRARWRGRRPEGYVSVMQDAKREVNHPDHTSSYRKVSTSASSTYQPHNRDNTKKAEVRVLNLVGMGWWQRLALRVTRESGVLCVRRKPKAAACECQMGGNGRAQRQRASKVGPGTRSLTTMARVGAGRCLEGLEVGGWRLEVGYYMDARIWPGGV